MQSKKQSLHEALTNIYLGFLLSLLSSYLVFPLFGINIPVMDNVYITLWFTAISLMRSYALRRWFNRKAVRNKWKLTDQGLDYIATLNGHGKRPRRKIYGQG